MYDESAYNSAEAATVPADPAMPSQRLIHTGASDQERALWNEHGFALSPKAAAIILVAALCVSWLAAVAGSAS